MDQNTARFISAELRQSKLIFVMAGRQSNKLQYAIDSSVQIVEVQTLALQNGMLELVEMSKQCGH